MMEKQREVDFGVNLYKTDKTKFEMNEAENKTLKKNLETFKKEIEDLEKKLKELKKDEQKYFNESYAKQDVI